MAGLEGHTVHAREKAPEAGALVIFGITGDLARKQTLRALYRLEASHHLACKVIGVARQDWSTQHLVDHARRSIQESGQQVDAAVFGRLARRLSYLPGDFSDPGTYQRLGQALAGWPTRCSTWRSRPACSPGWSVPWRMPG